MSRRVYDIKKLEFGVYRAKSVYSYTFCTIDYTKNVVVLEWQDYHGDYDKDDITYKSEHEFKWEYKTWLWWKNESWKYVDTNVKEVLWTTYGMWLKDKRDREVENIILGIESDEQE